MNFLRLQLRNNLVLGVMVNSEAFSCTLLRKKKLGCLS